MAQRDGRLEPIDVQQRGLHFQKEVVLEKLEGSPWFHVTEKFINDIYKEINFLRETINSQSVEVVIPVLESFVNNGETILVNGIGAALYEPDTYDVVLLPDVSTLQNEYPQLVLAALRVARKRVLVGYYANALKDRFESFLDGLKYTWLKNEEPMEYYIIEKENVNGSTETQRETSEAQVGHADGPNGS